jgi:hypothetical protein
LPSCLEAANLFVTPERKISMSLFRKALPGFKAANRAHTGAGRVACLSVVLLTLAACKSAPVDDGTLSRNVQSSLSDDSALSGLGIQGSVQQGVATLSGNAQNDAQRSLAARDASAVQGIRQVVNNISLAPVAPASAAVFTPPPPPVPAPMQNTTSQISPVEARRQRELQRRQKAEGEQALKREQRNNNQPAPIERAETKPSPADNLPPRPLPVLPQPVFRDLTVPAGYAIAVRVTQTLDSADAQQGQTFSGIVANDVMADGVIALAAGTRVSGQVDNVQDAGHFKGSSMLTVSLTSVTTRGERVSIATDPYTVQGKGRGKNTLEKTGGGAAVGAILGGIFGGGKGAAIGAAAGGGIGAGSNAITRGEQVQILSESIVRFRLSRPVLLHVRADGQAGPDNSPSSNDPALQRRPQ